MPHPKVKRVKGTTWVFPVTWRQRASTPTGTGERQSIAGASSFKAEWLTPTGEAAFETDTTGFTTDETADPATFGDFTYVRDDGDQTEFPLGTYRLRFVATMNGEPVPTPEDGYMIVEVIA